MRLNTNYWNYTRGWGNVVSWLIYILRVINNDYVLEPVYNTIFVDMKRKPGGNYKFTETMKT